MDQWLKGRLCVIRYLSVECTVVVPRRFRRRFGTLVCARWRLPAHARRTFPPAVILNRLATDFLVLMPLGRRISQLSFKKSAQYQERVERAQAIISVNARAQRGPSDESP